MTLSDERAGAGTGPLPPADRPDPVTRPNRLLLALSGVLAGALALGFSALISALLHEAVNPVVGIAELVRDLTPGALAERLIHLVGHLDKPLLIGGTVLVALAISAALGLLPARRWWLSTVVIVALGVLGYVGVQARPSTPLNGLIATAVGIAVWIAALSWLVSAARAVEGPPASDDTTDQYAHDDGPGSTRRTFLVRSALVAGGAVVTVTLSRVAGAAAQKVQQARVLLRLPATKGVVPAGANLEVPGAVPWRTDASGFYLVHTAISAPQIQPKNYRLRIHGMVDRPIEISYADLAGRRFSEDWITLCCVSNEVGGDLIGNAHWSGVPIRELLAEAGVQAGADAVKQTSADGWTCGTPLSALTDQNRAAMLALAMNGQPLPVEHGFPVRMVVPGLYGYVSATKWLVDLEVTRFADFSAYWTQRGWGEKGPVKTESRIDIPQEGMGLQTGKHAFGGVAWAQHTGITKVEVRLDGKAWQETQLGRVPGNDTWVQWKADFDLPAGEHSLAVRATDRSGYTQTSARADVLPDGATGWHEVSFSVG